MSEQDKISLRVEIGDRAYPLRVAQPDQSKVLQAAEAINEKISQYKSRYSDKDMQDFIAMTALQLATQLAEKEQNPMPIDDLKMLNDQLEKYIQSIQRS